MTEPAKKTRSEMIDSVVEYENAMREGADVLKSGGAALAASMDQDMGTGGIWDSEFRAFIDSMTLKQLFFSETWVYILVDLVAMKIASQPIRVMTGVVDETGQYIKKPAEGHTLQDLIENPNPYQAYTAWMYCMVVDLTLLGNSILWYASQANYLMILPGESVTMDIDASGTLLSYNTAEINSDGGQFLSDKKTKFAVEDIMHMRRPNPSSLLWGLSPFIPGRKSVLFNRYSQDYLNSFYQKGAMPGFALEMDKEANERVAMRLLRSFENAYTGRKNMRRTLVLPKGVSLKEVSHSLADQDLAIYIDKNREDIINLLKVPKHELSLQASGSMGSDEANSALKNFWHATLIPMMRIIEGELTKFFRRRGQLEGVDQFLEFDLTSVEPLQEDRVLQADLAKKMLESGWSINEVRSKIWHLKPATTPGTDDPFLVFPKSPTTPFALGIHQPQQVAPAAATLALPAADDKADTGSRTKAAKDKLSSFLKGGDGWWSRREAHAREAVAKGTHEMEKAVLKMFADMAVTITKAVKAHLKEKSWDTLRTKADERSKLVGKAELRRKLRKGLDKFETQWIDNTREVLSARVDVGYGVALELPFNMGSESELAGLRERGASMRAQALEARAERAFSYMNETTVEGVYATIEKGIDAGKTVQEIAGDLRSKFSDIEEIGSRAMTIARTEVLTAVSLGQASAMADAAKLIPDLMKMWLTADDDRVRHSHEQLHGDFVEHDEEFSNGLQFPRDPEGDASEVINCRCTWIMVPKDQMANIDDSLAAAEET